jgi:hypothetical protein
MTDHRDPCATALPALPELGSLLPPALLLPAALLAALLLAADPAQSGPLADPTRPPAALSAPGGLAAAALPHQANRDTARALAAAARAAEPPPPAIPAVVQAVQVPARGAALALVDGRQVAVGDQLDGRKVLAIDAQGLLVQGAKGPERLWLLAGAAKQTAGTIVQSQAPRYVAAPVAGDAPGGSAATAAAAGADAAGTAVRPRADSPAADKPVTSVPASILTAPAARSLLPGADASTAALPTPLSLAGRTAP